MGVEEKESFFLIKILFFLFGSIQLTCVILKLVYVGTTKT